MARHYSTKDFFRQMPDALLARYFQECGLFGDMDFAVMKETKPDELFTAWLEIPEETRNPMDAEFQDIFVLSSEQGTKAIIDQAEFHWQGENFTAFTEKLSAWPTISRGRCCWTTKNPLSLFGKRVLGFYRISPDYFMG